MDFDLEKLEDEPEKAVKSEPVNDGFDIFSDVENSDDEKDKRKKKKDRKRSRSRDRKDRKRSRSRDRRRSRSRDRKGTYHRYEKFQPEFTNIFDSNQYFTDKRRRKRSDDVDVKTEKPEASDKPKYFDEIEKDEEITTDVTLKGKLAWT